MSQTVHDEVAAGALDDSRGDRQSLAKILVIVKHAPLGDEVVGAGVSALALVDGKVSFGGAAADPRGDIAGPPLENGERSLGDPPLGVLVPFLEEAPGGVPQIFEQSSSPGR